MASDLVYVQQKLFKAPNLFEDVPVQVTFVDSDWSSTSVVQMLSGEHESFTVSLPFNPSMVYLNKDSQLLHAVTGVDLKITTPGSKDLSYAKMRLNIIAEGDSSFLRIEHYRVAPDSIRDPITQQEFAISPDRYWKVDGILSNSFESKARLEYNSKDAGNGNLDNGLMIDHNGITFNEDSLVLLWRSNQKVDWKEYEYYDIMTLSDKTDGYGYINLTKLLKGEYAFGFRMSTLSTINQKLDIQVKIYPNPTNDSMHIEWDQLGNDKKIEIYSESGKLMKSALLKGNESTISTKDFPREMYHIVFYKDHIIAGNKKFIKD